MGSAPFLLSSGLAARRRRTPLLNLIVSSSIGGAACEIELFAQPGTQLWTYLPVPGQ